MNELEKNLISTCSNISEKLNVMKGLFKHSKIINKSSYASFSSLKNAFLLILQQRDGYQGLKVKVAEID